MDTVIGPRSERLVPSTIPAGLRAAVDATIGGVPGGLLERAGELAALRTALAAASSGDGRVVLVTGEAGIGKSSLIREFLDGLDSGVRVVAGACDDLLAPRALGPLRDAVTRTGGPLERALAGPPETVFGALHARLADGPPTVLVVDDIQWADEATLDVLLHVARRITDVPAVLVLSVRDEAVVEGHPVRDLLGLLAGPAVVRLPLGPLSSVAVAAMSAAAGRDGSMVYGVTGGNPFHVTETLAVPGGEIPGSVADAVLARLLLLSPECVAALEQLSVVPTIVDFPLAEALLGDRLEALAEAEERGMVEVRPLGLAFRHELARRAVEAALSQMRRRALNRHVVRVLRESPEPDGERLVHHAVAAGDADTIVEFAPAAGRAAAAAGSHRQALAHLEVAAAHVDRLPPDEQTRLVLDHAWELYLANRLADAVAASRDGVRRCERAGDPDLLAEALVRLSRHVLMAGESDEAEALAVRAVDVLRDRGSAQAMAAAATYHGATLVLTGQARAALPVLKQAMTLAAGVDRPDLTSLALNYRGFVRAELDELATGESDMRAALQIALASGSHEAAARAYVNLNEMLDAYGDRVGFAANVEAGYAFAIEHGLQHYTVLLELHRSRVLVHRGEWDDAELILAALVARCVEPSMFDSFVHAGYGRLLARRGRPGAGELMDRAWRQAMRLRQPVGTAHAGRAVAEWAWLTGNPERAREVAVVLLPRMTSACWAHPRGELLRYLARAGLPVEPFAGCPEGWAAGLRGDWRAAAAEWERVGDSYERALELGLSGEVEPMSEAVAVLDDLDAQAPALLVRHRLRELGVTRPPLRRTAVRANPADLTARQLDVLELLGEGATNAQIAARLALSVRTVDHHVAAILARLGARTRREAVARARALAPGPVG